MSFVNPAYLWALSGLLVPIGIHLLSRKEGKVIKVGSLRHVEESNTSRFKSIRLNEIWLLLLRCLMIVLLVMFMGGARCSQIPFTTSVKWVLIEKELENNPRVKSQVDSLVKTGFEVRYLAKDFPLRDRTTQADDQQNYWQLIEQLNEKIGYDIIVFSQSRLSNFYGKRVELSSFIRWIPVESDENKFIASAIQLSSDSVRVRMGTTSSTETSFINEIYTFNKNENWFALEDRTDSVLINKPDTITVSILADETFKHDGEILTAALKTLQNEFNFELFIQNKINLSADWIFWLSEKPFIESTDSKILQYHQSSQRPLLEKRTNCTGILQSGWIKKLFMKKSF